MYKLKYCRKCEIELLADELDRGFSLYVLGRNRKYGLCVYHHNFKLSIHDLYLDQHGKVIDWQVGGSLPDNYEKNNFTSWPNRDGGYETSFTNLKYSIANCMNWTMNDRGFSRYFKKMVVGEWRYQEVKLIFRKNETYSISGNETGRIPALIGIFKNGFWSCSNNVLFYWDKEKMRGERQIIHNINDNTFLVAGDLGILSYALTRI